METAKNTNNLEISQQLMKSKADYTRNETPCIVKPTPLFFSKRLLVTILLFLSYVNFQILRNNMNIAVVEMTSNKTISVDNGTMVKPPEFNWNAATVGCIVALINFGGQFAFLNGFVIEKLGPSVSCATSMLLSGLLTFLHPLALYQSFYVFLACRLLTGLFEAGFYASTSEIFSRWFPLKERSTLIAYSFNGTNAGVAIVYPFCGFLAHTWGWKMVFYVTGALSVFISVIFLVQVRNHPSQDKRISKAELAYILQGKEAADFGRPKGNFIDVFKPIVKSAEIWALLVLVFTYMWMATVITASLPLYIKDLTGKESDEIGYLSSIPNAIYIFLFPVVGAFMDYWKNHSKITLTKIHKIMMSTSYVLAIILFIGITFVSNVTTSLVIFVLVQIFTCAVPLIIPIITVCLAPNHISHVTSISCNFFLLGAFGSQTVTGFMTTNHSIQEWNNSFYVTSGVALLGAVVFVLLGSSEPQSWSLSPSAKQEGHSMGAKNSLI